MQPILSSSSSTAITKRMSWNNEQPPDKNDSSIITNSFRSVHSSSGVSSTGSFLFSTDEDASIITTTTTSSSIPCMVASTDADEFDRKSSSSTVVGTHEQTVEESIPPESSLRRTPFPSVKKRHQTHACHRAGGHQPQQAARRHRVYDETTLHSSTHTIIYDSSKPTINETNVLRARNSLAESGNESDYDNNIPSTKFHSMPSSTISDSNRLLRSDDLLLGDQNEITLDNDTHIDLSVVGSRESETSASDLFKNHLEYIPLHPTPQSDMSIRSTATASQRTNRMAAMKSSTTTTRSDETIPYRTDPLINRRLLDIRSHLLLNTTLDAT